MAKVASDDFKPLQLLNKRFVTFVKSEITYLSLWDGGRVENETQINLLSSRFDILMMLKTK